MDNWEACGKRLLYVRATGLRVNMGLGAGAGDYTAFCFFGIESAACPTRTRIIDLLLMFPGSKVRGGAAGFPAYPAGVGARGAELVALGYWSTCF